IKEDLAKVKDGLDIFVRSEIPLVADLLPLVDTLSQTADTLGMLGMGIPRTTIMDQVAVIRDMAQGKLEFSDAALMDLAGALLRVEAALDDLVAMQDHKEVMGGGGAAARDGAAAGMALELGAAGDAVTDAKSAFSAEAEDLFNDVEYRQLLSAVVREAKADMSRVKDDITGFITVPMQHNLLIDVPRVMTRIMGSLSMLAQTRAAQLMDACRKRIVDDLVEKKIVPAPAQLDTLAEVISGIEYYLEALNEGRSDRDSILDQAEQRMEQLDFALAAITPLATASGAEPAGADDAVSEPGHAQIYDRAEMPQAGQTDAAQHHQYDAALIQPPEPVNPLSGAAPLSLFNIALSAPSEEIDEEIIQIFLEEADEELASIAVQLPQWQHNQADKNALTTVRRSFHTLKGSGRMVGAMVVGEFAWAFENMLNRVIDGTVPVKPEMFELIQQAQLALPQLIEQFKGGGPPAMDVQALVDQAKAIIQANQPAAAAGPSSAPPLPSPGVSVPAVEPVSRMADVASLAEPVAQAAQSAANAETMLPDVDGVLETASGAPEDITAAVGTETVCEIAPALAPQPAANDSATPDTVLPVPEAGVEQLYLPPAIKSTPRIDLVLLEIFSKEAAGHLAAIQGFTDRCAVQAEDCLVTEALVRTLHTLHGSAGMAGVAAIAEPSGLLEKYAKRLSARQAMIGAEVANMLRDSVVFIGDMLTALYDANLPQPDGSTLLTTISALYEAEVASHSGLTQEQERVAQEEWVERQTSGLALPDKDADIVEIFLEEGREILDATEIILQHWMAEQHNHKFLEELQRELHTLKGGARMAGLSAIGDLSHSMEAVITGIVEGYLPLSPRLPELMQQTQDRLLQMLDHASVNLPIAPAQDLIALIEQLMEVKPEARQALPDNSLPAVSPAPEMPAPEDSIAPVGEDSSIRVEDEGADDQAAFMEEDADEVDQAERMERGTDEADQVEADQRRVSLRPQHEQVRVRADLLDSLVNFAAEISISRARIEQQIGSYKYNLEEMDQIVARLRGQLR
ncbi:MAG TPA: Hpt domain-containing protein, partial [Gammaproteobacteria bacterium]|nr:Hpt domain-containing protein [Gammaproteobacteria bacterium]